MSTSGAVRGGATFTQGTFAARPAASSNALYYATDTGEWWIANAAGNAWQSISQTSAAKLFVNAIEGVGGASWSLYRNGSQSLNIGGTNGLVNSSVAGRAFGVPEGANAKQGTTGAMTAGSVTVANTSVTANSRIFVCRSAGGTNPGAWYVSAQTAGTSFIATSTNAADTGNGVFEIFEPG